MRIVVAAMMLMVCACGGSSSPVAPTPPPPAPPTLTFQAEASNPNYSGNLMWLQGGGVRDGMDPGTIWIGVMLRVMAGLAVNRVEGELRFDPSVLVYDAWGKGTWFEQGDTVVTWTHGITPPGRVLLMLSRPSTVIGARGEGDVIWIRLKPAPNVRSGSTPIQWDTPRIYGASGQMSCVVRAGTVTIQ
jgi:hypothetical protein